MIMENITFNPLDWARNEPTSNAQSRVENVNNQPSQAVSTPTDDFASELQKAQAVCDDLLSRGANIAESYEDYLQLGFALADGLGSEGRDIYHRLCAQSAKYREQDCERKWQECLRKHDGRTTIASFYKMAQDAGVDLSAIARQFPSKPSNPHCSFGEGSVAGQKSDNYLENTLNKGVMPMFDPTTAHDSISPDSREGMREVRVSEVPADESEAERRFRYSETFSDKLNTIELPSLLREVMDTQQDAEGRDKVGIGALVEWSGAMPNVEGVYDQKRVSAEMYAILNAPSGIANKGAVDACRQLVMPIEWEIRRQQLQAHEDYERQLGEWQALTPKERKGKQEPKEPKYQSLFIAANSSAPVVYEDLSQNDGRGIIFETEADTLANVQTQEWGQWSDLLRKAYHHERVTLSRKSDNLRIVIEHPRLAVLLTCTPGQIPLLLPANQVENGLANRFLFYCLNGKRGWRSPFQERGEPLEDKMLKIGQRFYKLYQALQQRTDMPLEFTFSEEQKDRFNAFFAPLYNEQIGMIGDELSAYIFRLGLSTFRMAMVLTVLRCADREPMLNPESKVLVCSDTDFQTALTISNCLINHTTHVYANILPHAEQPMVAPDVKMPDRQRQLLMAVGDEFTTAQWYDAAAERNIPKKTAERYLGEFTNKYHLTLRIFNGRYRKNIPH